MKSIYSRCRVNPMTSFSHYRLLSTTPSNTTSVAESAINISQYQRLLVVELNRPKALNALSLDMCAQIRSLITDRINGPNSDIGAFVVKGAGGKAFCAGGDVKAMWQELVNAGKENSPLPLTTIGTGKPGSIHADFFRQEYLMNYLVGTSVKPQISFWDGIVMGGGVGLSVLGEFRVATEKSLFAMPETAIGIFADVGSTAWLPHLPDGYGAYIGLTGARLGPAELIHSGIATHFISGSLLAELENELQKGLPLDPAESRKYIKAILDDFQGRSLETKPDPSQSVLAKNQEAISKCFGENVATVEQIFALLKEESAAGNEWATKTLETANRMSPTSLKLGFSLLKRGKDQDLKSCLQMEYRLMMSCMKNSDFKEGVRALLVDRDNKPAWKPATLEEISDATVDAHFASLGEYELTMG